MRRVCAPFTSHDPGMKAAWQVKRFAAGSGLIAFALTVALVQQSVRGAIEANVKTGGTLFEINHVRVPASQSHIV